MSTQKLPILIGDKQINLTEKAAEGGNTLKRVYIGLDWEIEPGEAKMDFDGLAIMLNENRKLRDANSFVYYGTQGGTACNGALEISKDNTTGDDDDAPNKYNFTDDEFMVVDTDKITEDKCYVDIIVNLYNAVAKGQTFGDAEKATVRIVDLDTKEELAKMVLSAKASNATSVLFGTLAITPGDINWKTKGTGLEGTATDIVNTYV